MSEHLDIMTQPTTELTPQEPQPLTEAKDPNKPLGWFQAMPNGTLAVISLTCTTIALVSFALEMLVRFLVDVPALGHAIGLPVPFVSIPLGLGGVVTTCMLTRTRVSAALIPAIFSVLYIALVIVFWP